MPRCSARTGGRLDAGQHHMVEAIDRGTVRLFTQFFLASSAVGQAVPGTGLGLAIVGTIVTSHGGQISVKSRERAGTTFGIHLPLRAPVPA